MTRKLLVAGNWKLNGSLDMTRRLVAEIKHGLSSLRQYDVAVFPAFLHIPEAVNGANGELFIGGQTLSEHKQGAYTGEVSGAMLKECGCQMVLVGHSERRIYHGEDDALLARQFAAALQAGLKPILCCGETLEQRQSGQTKEVISSQILTIVECVGIDSFAQAIIAYEPVWAIGTGKTATAEQAQEVHAHIRSLLTAKNDTIATVVPILYGGSVKGDNAKELFSMQDIDGGLIGGASLTSEDFLAICEQADRLSSSD